jgi:hypothetical protein
MYGELPVDLGKVEMNCDEMLFYQYLPVKLAGQTNIKPEHIESRLHWLIPMVGKVCCDFVAFRGLNEYVESNVYVTAKHMYQSPGCSFNREGWHSDGFLTDDVNYIWSNCFPTIFNSSSFTLTLDDTISMTEMERQAKPENDVTFPDCHVLRLTQDNIHRVADITHGQIRTFVKVSISRDIYNLKGNAKNHLLNYDWVYRERKTDRNIPQNITSSTGTR